MQAYLFVYLHIKKQNIMENQEQENVLTNQELKQKHWKEIKKDFISKIPKQFKIEAKGIEENSIYYHPIITLTDGFYIHSQCDIKTNRVYGYTLQSNRPISFNGFVHTMTFNLYDDKLEYVLNNYPQILKKLIASENEILKIYQLISLLHESANKISDSAIDEIIDKNELKKSIRSLEEVTEYLENQRY